MHENDCICHSLFYVYVKWIFFELLFRMAVIYQICKWTVPAAVFWYSFKPGSGELEQWLALFPGKTALMIHMTGASPGQITTKISASAASHPGLVYITGSTDWLTGSLNMWLAAWMSIVTSWKACWSNKAKTVTGCVEHIAKGELRRLQTSLSKVYLNRDIP